MERLPHGTRRLAVQLRTPIKESLLWDVLTDYDKLSEFIVLANFTLRETVFEVGQKQLHSYAHG